MRPHRQDKYAAYPELAALADANARERCWKRASPTAVRVWAYIAVAAPILMSITPLVPSATMPDRWYVFYAVIALGWVVGSAISGIAEWLSMRCIRARLRTIIQRDNGTAR